MNSQALNPTNHAAKSIRLGRFVTIVVTIVGYFSSFVSTVTAQDLYAEKVYGWDFRRVDDRNLDRWPDDWRRRRDRQHPHYIQINIVPRDAETDRIAKTAQLMMARGVRAWESGRWNPNYIPEVTPPAIAEFMDRYVLDSCLEISMDGGAAELIGPKFLLDARFAYTLKADVSCRAMLGHKAWVELHLLDAAENAINVLSTEPIVGDVDWQNVETPIAAATDAELRWGQIHMKVVPLDSTHYTGAARFDSIEIYRLPRLTLSTPLVNHVARPDEAFEVTCAAMGIHHAGSSVSFELRDVHGELLRQESIVLEPIQRPNPATIPDAPPRQTDVHFVIKHDVVFDGVARWNLKLDKPGLYRAGVNLKQGSGSSQSRNREILIAVMKEAPPLQAGPFGWALPAFGGHLQPEDVPHLVKTFGAGYVKIPIWFDATDTQSADRLIALADRLQSLGTECIGRLDAPPASHRALLLERGEMPLAVSIFKDSSAWERMLEPVITRMGMKIAWFQLGADDDLSFMAKADVAQLLSNIRTQMQSFSQELKLSLNWNWLTPLPDVPDAPWDAVFLKEPRQLTAAELEAYTLSEPNNLETWVALDPLAKSKYTLLDRVRDLTERMIVVKRMGIDAAFVSNPFDPERGLLTLDQKADEMLIPWHTLVSDIGSSDYLGSIQMPGGSVNHIFRSGDEGLMLLWNDTPTTEQLFLGEDIRASDIWGRDLAVSNVPSSIGGMEQQIEVGSWPIFLRGLNTDVVQWRQQFELQLTHLASSVGAGQAIPISIENTFPQTASGTMTLVSETLFEGGKASTSLQLTGQRRHDREIPILIRNDASAGLHDLRIDLDLVADKPYKFSVYRSITLGLGEIEFLWEGVRIDENTLELRIELINHTAESVSFDCKLFPPGQAYRRVEIMNAAPGNTLRQVVLPIRTSTSEGIWVRCEQIGPGRILNYRLKL